MLLSFHNDLFCFFALLAALLICSVAYSGLISLTDNILIPISKYLRFPFCHLADFPLIGGGLKMATDPLLLSH